MDLAQRRVEVILAEMLTWRGDGTPPDCVRLIDHVRGAS
jgi:hypothetical protein